MEEERKQPRTDVDQLARICCGGMTISCRLLNISAEGAAVEVANATHIPDRFQLMTEHNRDVFNCRIAWIKQNRIGLTFE